MVKEPLIGELGAPKLKSTVVGELIEWRNILNQKPYEMDGTKYSE